MTLRGWLALLPILLGMLSGCSWTENAERPSWLKRFDNQAISPNHALIEVALIERPLHDETIDQGIWRHTDELIVDLEQHGLLDENGLRLGQLVGVPPSDFQQLLLSKRCCSNPEAMIFAAGKIVTIYLGPVYDRTTYELVLGKRRSEESFDQARFCLDVEASFVSDGRTKFTFTPKVENGAATLPFHAAPDQSTWEYRVEKANKKYPELSWEVTLATNQYLIIGGRTDRENTLGEAAFTQSKPRPGIQRLLVVRNCRSLTSNEAHQNSAEELIRADKSPPLALQATIPAIRAKNQ